MLALHFDPSVSLVAASAFNAGEERIEAGAAFDWRARGLTEIEASAMFGAGLLTAAPASVAKQQPQSSKRK